MFARDQYDFYSKDVYFTEPKMKAIKNAGPWARA